MLDKTTFPFQLPGGEWVATGRVERAMEAIDVGGARLLELAWLAPTPTGRIAAVVWPTNQFAEASAGEGVNARPFFRARRAPCSVSRRPPPRWSATCAVRCAATRECVPGRFRPSFCSETSRGSTALAQRCGARPGEWQEEERRARGRAQRHE